MRHKHADVIHAWAEGADIEIKNEDGKWVLQNYPLFYPRDEYRIKPKEPEWWENIPEHGILVKGETSGQVIALYGRATTYTMWTPLTNEEIERIKR